MSTFQTSLETLTSEMSLIKHCAFTILQKAVPTNWLKVCLQNNLSVRLKVNPCWSIFQFPSCSSLHLFQCFIEKCSTFSFPAAWRDQRSLSLCPLDRGSLLLPVLPRRASGSPCSAAHSQARLRRNGPSLSTGTRPLQGARRTAGVYWHVRSSLSLWLLPRRTPGSSGGTAGSESPQRRSGH